MVTKRLLTFLFVALLGTALAGFLAGCPVQTDDDDDASGDDDTGDDDTGDDDTGDDDVDSPYGYMIEVGMSVTGGVEGGTSTTSYDHIMIDQNQNPLCTISLEFEGDYTYGPGQGDEYYQFIDETLTWTSGTELSNDCPAEWAIYDGDPVEAYMWYMHPMAFVSCDLVATVGNLAETFLGKDDSEYIPVTDGTFGDFCDNAGPAYQSAAGTGPMEGVWLMPGISGELDSLGDFAYFEAPAPGSADYDSWILLGVLMADAANTSEPVEGLEGDYSTIPFWLWVYSG
jgi:hypothetical protein